LKSPYPVGCEQRKTSYERVVDKREVIRILPDGRNTFGILRGACFEKGATGPEALILAIRLRGNHDSGSDQRL